MAELAPQLTQLGKSLPPGRPMVELKYFEKLCGHNSIVPTKQVQQDGVWSPLSELYEG